MKLAIRTCNVAIPYKLMSSAYVNPFCEHTRTHIIVIKTPMRAGPCECAIHDMRACSYLKSEAERPTHQTYHGCRLEVPFQCAPNGEEGEEVFRKRETENRSHVVWAICSELKFAGGEHGLLHFVPFLPYASFPTMSAQSGDSQTRTTAIMTYRPIVLLVAGSFVLSDRSRT